MALKDLSPRDRAGAVLAAPALGAGKSLAQALADEIRAGAQYAAARDVGPDHVSDDATLAKLLNAPDAADPPAVQPARITAAQILTAMAPADALSQLQATHLQILMSAIVADGGLDPTAGNWGQYLNRVWAANTVTRANLLDLVKRSRTRAELVAGEIGFAATYEDVGLALRPPA